MKDKAPVQVSDGIEQREITRSDHIKFVKNMRKHGIEPYWYEGRWFWKGPAVTVSDLQDALSVAKVPCQWDRMGLDYVVYPKTSA